MKRDPHIGSSSGEAPDVSRDGQGKPAPCERVGKITGGGRVRLKRGGGSRGCGGGGWYVDRENVHWVGPVKGQAGDGVHAERGGDYYGPKRGRL